MRGSTTKIHIDKYPANNSVLASLTLNHHCLPTKFIVSDEKCDKKVIVKRKSGEFGFRIHGSRPVVVSAIEPDTPAETSGLEVGDIVLSVNGVSILEASHSDVVKLAHAGSDILELEVARTSSTLTAVTTEEKFVLISGFLSRRGSNDRWHQRWFTLKNDNCLYYFKSQTETQPIGALMLFNYKFKFTPESGMANSFILQKEGAKSFELCADTMESAQKWKAQLEKAMEVDPNGEGQWFNVSCELLQRPASSVPQPDCFGHLTQLEDKWRRRYCVLKDTALLLYADSTASRALAVACLQGYRVQSSGVSGKRFSFEVVPPESKQKHFYFYTDTEMDKKR
ncbi:hypothetical protein RUM43_003759 [Polyplax serrata]|uniref:Uncharacterized protein n=1 Tax=Polyplax serrata TaxID=468196 RepID=A0AAN8PFF3_POLSC